MNQKQHQLTILIALLLLVFHQASSIHACSCGPCTKSVTIESADTYQLIDNFNSCPEGQSAGYDEVRLIAANGKSLFQYHVVDEENYKLAIQGKEFTEILGSGQNAYSCVGRYTDVRVPNPLSGIYVLAKGENGTVIKFAPTGTCFVAPATSVQVSYLQNGVTTSRVYTNSPFSVNFNFVNQFSNVDTWQNGYLELNDSRAVNVNKGLGQLTKQLITAPQQQTLLYDYVPNSDRQNPNDISDVKVNLNIVQMSSKFTVEAPTSANPVPYEIFKIPFKSVDSDGIITPTLFLQNFKIQVKNVKDQSTFDYLICKFPSLNNAGVVGTGGEDSLSCISQATGKFSVSILIERGQEEETLTSFQVEVVNAVQPAPPISPIEIAAISVSGVALLISVIAVSALIYVLWKTKFGKFGYTPMN